MAQPTHRSPDQVTGDGSSRRAFLTAAGAGLSSLVLPGCPHPRADPRWYQLRVPVEGRVHHIRIERRPRTAPLALNETPILRRYTGHTSPRVREAQLVWLARMATAEEAFLHTHPDNLWTEVGFLTERGKNPWQGHGIRLLPLPALLSLWSGRVAGFRRPRRVTNYHNHPVRFVQATLRALGHPSSWRRLVDLPSAGDLFVHARLKHAFARRGVPVVSRVAAPDALVQYDVADSLRARILKSKGPHEVRALAFYESARLSYAKNDISRDFFREVLASRFHRAGFPKDSVTLAFDTRVPTVG